MNRVQSCCLIAGMLLAGTSYAGQPFVPSGSSLTYGYTSNAQNINAYSNNPAMGASSLKDGDGHFKMGLIGITLGAELGAVDNIEKSIEDLSNQFDANYVDTNNNGIIEDAEVQAAVNNFNSVLATLDQDGYFKVSSNVSLLSPLVISANWLGGSLVFDLNASTAFKGKVLQEDIVYGGVADNTDDIVINNVNGTITINNDSSVQGAVAAVGEFSLAYSRAVSSNGNGDWYAGARVKMLRVGLFQDAIKFSDANNNISSSITDYSADDIQSALTADVGLLYASQHYRAGLTLTNLTQPSFDYNTIDLTAWDPNKTVYPRLLATQTWTMDRQLKLEGAWYSESRNWVINGAFDTNAAKDPFGDEFQWMVVSAAYASDSFLIPGFRAGLRQNLAGTKLSYLTVGTTLFNFLDIDAALSNETVQVDGSSYPRSFFVSIGTGINF